MPNTLISTFAVLAIQRPTVSLWATRSKIAHSVDPHQTLQTISPQKSACGKVSRVGHMVPGGSRESLPKRKVRFADQPPTTPRKALTELNSRIKLMSSIESHFSVFFFTKHRPEAPTVSRGCAMVTQVIPRK